MRHLIGVATVALAAMLIGMVPSSALASAGFEAEALPATISGTQEGNVIFVQDSLEVVCKASTLTASIASGSEASETLTATPTYSECTSAGNAMTVTTTGCSYLLHAGSEAAENEFSGELDVSCAAEKSIKISGRNCESKIETQSKLSGLTETDHAESSPPNFTLKLAPTKIKYTKTKDGEGCPFSGTGTKENGSLTQTDVEKGKNEEVSGDGVNVVLPAKLCKANEVMCEPANLFESKTVIEAEATNARFKTEGTIEGKPFSIEIKCGSSSIVGQSKDITGHPRLQIEVTAFSIQKCTAGTKACTVAAQELPYTGWVGHVGALKVIGMMVPNVTFSCEPTPEFNCKYGNTFVNQRIDASGGNPLVLTKNGALSDGFLFKRFFAEEKNCTVGMEWTATYTVTKPTQVWITS
ncbi:MAG TPA: hypothetical protein VMT37_13245 [Solirubrobacterales bacterium]|nr:hypothetical protein [Solirubrobacterales bacterium]